MSADVLVSWNRNTKVQRRRWRERDTLLTRGSPPEESRWGFIQEGGGAEPTGSGEAEQLLESNQEGDGTNERSRKNPQSGDDTFGAQKQKFVQKNDKIKDK